MFRIVVWCNTWYLENRYIRLIIKTGCEADMFNTVSGTKGTWRNIKKEMECLVLLVSLKGSNESEWGAPYFS